MTRPVRQRDFAVCWDQRLFDYVVEHLHVRVPVEVLHPGAVLDGCDQLAVEIPVVVGRDWHVVRRGRVGDFEPFSDAATDGGVRLDHVDGAFPQQFSESVARELEFARRDGVRQRVVDLRHQADAVGHHWLLDEVGVVLGDAPAGLERLGKAVPLPVCVDHQHTVVADGLPHGLDPSDLLGRRPTTDLHLYRVVPPVHVALHLRTQPLESLLFTVVATAGVRRHRLCVGTEILIQRRVGGLRGDVPERDIDGRDGPEQHPFPADLDGPVEHLPPEPLGVTRILADDHLGQNVSDPVGDDLGATIPEGVANALGPVGGPDVCDDVVSFLDSSRGERHWLLEWNRDGETLDFVDFHVVRFGTIL